jgi:hypothetical protein
MHEMDETPGGMSRRQILKGIATGFGYVAFAGLCAEEVTAYAPPKAGTKPVTGGANGAANPLAPKKPHFAPKAKRVIFLCMAGGPSHVDTFDYKPKLITDNGQSVGRRGPAKLLASPWKFRQHGKSGLWISDLFPEVAKRADDLCLIHGMHTDLPAHPQAFLQMHTGSFQFVRPSLGAWTLYGLGTENQNLPGFISINPIGQNGGAQNYGSSFLPAIHQGTPVRMAPRGADSARLDNIKNNLITTDAQRAQLDLMQSLNRERLQKDKVNPEVEGVIASYELAFRMQADVPKVMDLSSESQATLDLYGIGQDATNEFGRQCLLARRFVEAGVRFVEVSHGNWDQHRDLEADHGRHAAAVDRPIAALLTDLKQRGLLDDTLVIWAGEFGRTPAAQNGDGRDHNNKGYTIWMAGGGVRGGFSYGATDEYGFEAVDGRMHVHDLHATILHLLGLDHTRLTYRYAGRNFRLTDVHGNVATKIIA